MYFKRVVMDFTIDEDILERHVKIVLNSYFEDVFETSDYYNVRCNICGDSDKDVYKKRGFLLKTSDPWVFYCHNCNTSTTVVKWLKDHFTVNYKNLMIDIMRNRRNDPYYDDKDYNFKQKKGASDRDEKEDTIGFKKLTKFQDCVDYCVGRGIPKEVYSKWYYCTSGIYNGRIIITFRNDKGKVHYYQGRSFNNKNGVKYLSRFGDHNSIYNYYNVDPELPVMILEGPIDSVFVENSIAVTGLKLKGEELDKFKRRYFILDNDKSGYKEAVKLLQKRSWVFNWKKFLKDHPCKGEIKDVNDFILNNTCGITKLTWDIVGKYFTNKPMDKIYFTWKTV